MGGGGLGGGEGGGLGGGEGGGGLGGGGDGGGEGGGLGGGGLGGGGLGGGGLGGGGPAHARVRCECACLRCVGIYRLPRARVPMAGVRACGGCLSDPMEAPQRSAFDVLRWKRGAKPVAQKAVVSETVTTGQLLLVPMIDAAFVAGAGEADPDAHLGKMQKLAPPTKRCHGRVEVHGEMGQCHGAVFLSDDSTLCSDCRKRLGEKANAEQVRKSENPEKVKAASDAWNRSNAGQESKATYREVHREEIRKSNVEYNHGIAGIARNARYRAGNARKASNARYKENNAEKLKEKQDQWNHSPMGLLCRALYKMVTGAHWDPQSFPALGSFQSNEEAREHFQSQFEPWMSWENRGAHAKENEYDQVWNIGHWLPRAVFDPTNQEDLRRCWNPDNLFPQCAKKNTEYRDVLIYTDDELLERCHLWPVAANDDLDQLKSLFRYIAV